VPSPEQPLLMAAIARIGTENLDVLTIFLFPNLIALVGSTNCGEIS
jgi:hypothetical protein